MNAQPVLIPKAQLPECAVGETLTIVAEDGDNFVVEPAYEEEAPAPAPAKKAGKGKLPKAVAAVM
jgi:hypothetical protein